MTIIKLAFRTMKEDPEIIIGYMCMLFFGTGAIIIEIYIRNWIYNFYDPENLHLVHHVNQALRANHLFEKGKDYIVKDESLKIILNQQGPPLPGGQADSIFQAVASEFLHTLSARTGEDAAAILLQQHASTVRLAIALRLDETDTLHTARRINACLRDSAQLTLWQFCTSKWAIGKQ